MRMNRRYLSDGWGALALLFVGLTATPTALAQAEPHGADQPGADQPSAVLLPPRLRGPDLEGVGHAIERVLRTKLAEREVVELGPTPALALDDLQLALGCIAESQACLTRVAEQLEVEMLLILDVERAGDELLVTLSRFEHGDTELRTTTRRLQGSNPAAQALDEVDSIVRQAFGLEAAPETEVDAPGRSAPARVSLDAPPPPAPDPSTPEPVAPIALIGAGVVTMTVGFILGAVSQGTASEYENTLVSTVEDVDRATALFERAESEALAANVLIPVGGALAVAGATVWILQALLSGDEDEPDVAWSLHAGPNAAMLSVNGSFDGGAR